MSKITVNYHFDDRRDPLHPWYFDEQEFATLRLGNSSVDLSVFINSSGQCDELIATLMDIREWFDIGCPERDNDE